MKIFYKRYENKYASELKALADSGLSPGYLSEKELDCLGDGGHFCHLAVDGRGRLLGINYGRYLDIKSVSRELRCGEKETAELFPGVDRFAVDDGCVTLPEARGLGIATEITRFGFDGIFSRAGVLLFFVWNREGEEAPAVKNILRFGGKPLKSVPRYWYGDPDLICTRCGGRCVCTCDIYYLTKEGIRV